MTNKEKALKLINEYLAKQEPQKVELGLDDDIKNKAKEFNKLAENLGDFTRTILNARGGLQKAINKVLSEAKIMENLIEDYEKRLNDLGVDFEPPFLRTVKNKVSESKRQAISFEKDFL